MVCAGIMSCYIHTHTAIQCEPLAAIDNGMISYSTTGSPNYALGTVATYSCNTGFVLDLSVGFEMRTCVDDGDNDALREFSGTAPSCVGESVLLQTTPLQENFLLVPEVMAAKVNPDMSDLL